MIQVAKGHVTSGLANIVVPLRIREELHYERFKASDGLYYTVGGGKASLIAEALSFDEANALLYQFGVGTERVSNRITITLPNAHRIWWTYQGFVNFDPPDITAAWWTNFTLELDGLVRV